MNGIVAAVLTDLFGPASQEVSEDDGEPLTWYIWQSEDGKDSRLYQRSSTPSPSGVLHEDLIRCYGDFGGGFLVDGALRLASIDARDVYGLYRINELPQQPELQDVRHSRPELIFFMDAANVWFYGIADGGLVSYDSELGELTNLGDLATGLRELVIEWQTE